MYNQGNLKHIQGQCPILGLEQVTGRNLPDIKSVGTMVSCCQDNDVKWSIGSVLIPNPMNLVRALPPWHQRTRTQALD